MQKIVINIGDKIELWNGAKGGIIALNIEKFEVSIASPEDPYLQWYHKMNIKILNGNIIDAEYLTM